MNPLARDLEFSVGLDADGARLDGFLGSQADIGSRSRAVALIDGGLVAVDGDSRPKSFRLRCGSHVVVSLPVEELSELVPEDLSVKVVFEDRWLLVADKPPGMVTHPSRGHDSGTLVHALLGHGIAGGEMSRPGIVHRLDRDTSGLIVVAKDPATYRRLTRLIQERALARSYVALVHGNVAASSGTIDAPVGRDPVRRKTMTIGGAAARIAITHFEVLERLGDFTLVQARLETGRTHQIRVHFLAIGHPVAGDPVYARRDPLRLGRQFLHSSRIELTHPRTGEPLVLTSDLPADLAVPLTELRAGGRRE